MEYKKLNKESTRVISNNDPYLQQTPDGKITLKNKLSIFNHSELIEQENTLSISRSMEILNGEVTIPNGTPFEKVLFIHEYIFKDIYEWAGKLRKINISKGSTRFAPIENFEELIKEFNKVANNEEEIIFQYNTYNIFHPFREGNGRAGRIWLINEFRKTLEKDLHFFKIKKDDYMQAMISMDDQEIGVVIAKGKADLNLENQHVNWGNLVASHQYEGYYGDFDGQSLIYDTQPI